MKKPSEPQDIYRAKINEVFGRLDACEMFINNYQSTNSLILIESAVLQLRKALEALAYSAIAPNIKQYEKLRALAEKPADYRKDYNARAIVQHLAKINPDFYPSPLLPPERPDTNSYKLIPKVTGYLTLKNFENIYDRLGKFMHADNPWGNNKNLQNIINDMPLIIKQTKELLHIHQTIIRTPNLVEGWVVEVYDGKVVNFLIIHYKK